MTIIGPGGHRSQWKTVAFFWQDAILETRRFWQIVAPKRLNTATVT